MSEETFPFNCYDSNGPQSILNLRDDRVVLSLDCRQFDS